MGGCASMCSSNVHVPSSVRRDCYTQLTKTCSTGSVCKESCFSTTTFKIKHIKSLDDMSSTANCWENVNLLSNRSSLNQSVMLTNQGVPVLMLSSFSSSYSPSSNASVCSFRSKIEELPPITSKNTPIKLPPLAQSTVEEACNTSPIKKSHIPFILIHESSASKLSPPNTLPSLDYDFLVPES
ncbi:predicted protein [Naegleria gruberi]|uniref:Predicted protein n=1 Tax=Naegleria gruberi TaxID=5762 RepID=D2V8S8_NAEGR|nr:uncharacterized protein NAEGRDRAFT_65265 [Naegleria gruberi]EFC46742.1 predicted protein [Naegleria gruberi]|eukprot:XP_002679486.1 predicted protein [Naegleria gruberi strain NEG-M]